MKSGSKKGKRAEDAETSPVVKCDVCGRDFNRSYLKSHKRLSHGRKNDTPRKTANASEVAEMICRLYWQLPTAARKELLERLAALPETPPE